MATKGGTNGLTNFIYCCVFIAVASKILVSDIKKIGMFRILKFVNYGKVLNAKCHQELFKSYSNCSMFNAKLTSDERFVIVDVNKTGISSSEKQLKYPLIWLRDNCQCSECFHASSKSRTINWTSFDFNNAKPKNLSVSDDITQQQTYNILL